MLGVDEVLRGGRMGYYIRLIGRIRQIEFNRINQANGVDNAKLLRVIRLIGPIRVIRQIGIFWSYKADR